MRQKSDFQRNIFNCQGASADFLSARKIYHIDFLLSNCDKNYMFLPIFIHFYAQNVLKNCTIKLYLTKVYAIIHQYTFIKMPYFHNFLTTKTPIKIIFGLFYRLLCNINKKTKTPKTMKVLNNGHFGRFS